MSGHTIRIHDDGAFPDVSAVPAIDLGSTIEISDINDFDLGLLGNRNKFAGGGGSENPAPMKLSSGTSGGFSEIDNIEFVNLEDTSVSFDVKPAGPTPNDTIRILRDTTTTFPPMQPINQPAPAPAPAPAPTHAPEPQTKSWFNNLNPFQGSSNTNTENAPTTKSWFGNSNNNDNAPVNYLTPEDEIARKTKGLTLLERMDRKGIGGTKMTMANTLEEIDAEVARRTDSKGLEASVRFQRSMLTTVTSGMEFLNNRYDPLGIALDGWSEQVNENIEDYDEIFEELYDKYKDKSKVAPEVRLIMSLGLSAAMCHVTNTMFKSKMPGMDDILKKNPDLARQMARAAAEQAVGPGFANFVSMGMPGGGGGSEKPSSQMMEEDMGMDMGMGTRMPMMAPMGSGLSGQIHTKDPRGDVNIGVTPRREMRGPSGVDDILEQLNMGGRTPVRNVPPTANDIEEMGSTGSGITTETMRRAGMSRKRKPTSQPTGATLTLNV